MFLHLLQVKKGWDKCLGSKNGGNVGIGTTSPAKDLDVSGEIRASTGILFGTDTAAANTLDDYEEGTWTPVFAFGGASAGQTYYQQVGYYTKIGHRVFFNGICHLTGSKGTSTGDATITGLPFTAGSNWGSDSAVSVWEESITFANVLQAQINHGSNVIGLGEVTEGGVISTLTDANFGNESWVVISGSYPVD